jgi:hypothetical protein
VEDVQLMRRIERHLERGNALHERLDASRWRSHRAALLAILDRLPPPGTAPAG